MRSLLHISFLLVGATALGCQEDPSFRLRWAIDPSLALGESSKPTLASPADCSSVGVMDVRITTRDAFGLVVDRRKRPCYASAFERPEGTVAGPQLPPGPYAVEVRGVRRDDGLWSDVLSPFDELDPDPGCVPDLGVASTEQAPSCPLDSLVCDCAFVEVTEGNTVHLDDFVLDAPPQCQDGIDNDADGLVDMFDPACRLGKNRGELYAREDTQVIANAQLLVRPSVLHDNPVATCSGLGISRFVVTLEGATVAEPICADVLRRVFQAPAMVLPGERHTMGVVAVDFARQPLTVTKELFIDAPPGGGGRFTMEVDFGPEDFLQPIVSETLLLPRFASLEDAPGYERDCMPDTVAGGNLYVSELRMRLLGPRGKPLLEPAELSDGTPLDGETLFPVLGHQTIGNNVVPYCSNPTTEPLEWGEYLLEMEGLSPEGEVCFSNFGEPTLIAPGNSRVTIQRVLPMPASCRECEVDDHCETPSICDEGVCRPKCEGAPENCPPGTRCQQGICRG